MSDENMNRAQQLFLEAIELPAEQRDAWLVEQCSNDPELLNRVRVLLAHDQLTIDPLEQDPRDALAEFPDTTAVLDGDEAKPMHKDQEIEIDSDLFLTKLSRIGVISREELEDLSASLANGNDTCDPRDLAAQLVAEGKLTTYQASALLKGRPDLLLDKYLILDLIGAGGMGMVFKAIHRPMNRTVAVKMISQKLLNSSELIKRFQREVRVAATLEHPNIVRAYDADQSNGVHFLVLEYVRGENLAETVQRDGPLPLEDAVDAIIQSARGLGYAHEQGVVHRDVKPGNLMRSARGMVKVLDLGLANVDESFRLAQQSSAAISAQDPNAPEPTDPDLTHAGAVLGTVSYMAPEQSLKADTADSRSDIYGLGCTFYYLLTGEPPYSGETVFEVFAQHRDGEIPLLRAARPDVPASVEAVCARMLAKSPDDRYESMDELISALQACGIPAPEYASKSPKNSKSASRDRANGERESARKSNRGLTWLTLASLLIVLIGGSYGMSLLMGQWANRNRGELGAEDESTRDVRGDSTGDSRSSSSSVPDVPMLALEFDGVDDYVTIPSLKLDGRQPATIEVAVRVPAETGKGVLVTTQGRWIGLFQSRFNKSLQWQAGISSDSNQMFHMAPPTDGVVRLALVYDLERVTLFVDGRKSLHQRWIRDDSDGERMHPIRAGDGTWLGSSRFGDDQLHGVVSEVRVSNTARYFEDYALPDRLEADKDTLALYRFDEGQGYVLRDSSGNGHHGLIVGAKWVRLDGEPIEGQDVKEQIAADEAAPMDLLAYASIKASGDEINAFEWTRDELGLLLTRKPNTAGERIRVVFPTPPFEDYELDLKFSPLRARHFSLNLPIRGRMAFWLMQRDGVAQPAIENVDDQEYAGNVSGAFFESNKYYHVRVRVIHSGENVRILARSGEHVLLDYEGAIDRVSPAHKWRWLREFAFTSLSSVRLHSVTLRPITELERSKEDQPAIASAADLLASGEYEWRVVERLPEPINSSVGEKGGDISADGLLAVFSSWRGEGSFGKEDLWMTTRRSVEDEWSAAVNLGDRINTAGEEWCPALSPDGLTLVFQRDRKTWVSRRDSRSKPWSSAVPHPVQSKVPPDPSSSDLACVVEQFHRSRTGVQSRDLFITRRSGPDAPWPNPTRLPDSINSDDDERASSISDDGRLLVFHRRNKSEVHRRNKSGGHARLWFATRSGWEEPWEDPIPIKTTIESEHQGEPRLLPDGKSILFTVLTNDSSWDLYLARLVRKDAPIEPIKGLEHDEPIETSKSSPADLLASGEYEWRVVERLPKPINSQKYDAGADMTADELQIVFCRGDGLWTSTRDSTEHVWSIPRRLVNATYTEIIDGGGPTLSDDGRLLVFSRKTEDGRRIFQTSRVDRRSPWSAETLHPVNNSGYVAGPTLSNNGRTLVFSRGSQILSTTRTKEDEEWSAPVPLLELDKLNGAALSDDGRMLILIRIQDGPGRQRHDFWISTRESLTQSWTEPVPMDSLNSDGDETGPPNLLNGGHTMIFGSDRNGSMDLYLARLVRKDAPVEPIKGLENNEPTETSKFSPADLLTSGDFEWRVVERLPFDSMGGGAGGDMTADRLTLVFGSHQSEGSFGKQDLWISTRSALDAPWSLPVNLGERVNTTDREAYPALNTNGLQMLFKSGSQIMISSRENAQSAWSKPQPYELQAGAPPDPTANRCAVVLHRGRGDLYETRRASPDVEWAPVQRLPDPLNSEELEEAFGALSDDGRLLIFQRRPFAEEPNQGFGPGRLWMTTRLNWDSPWSDPTPIENLNIEPSTYSPRLVGDGTSLLFVSEREGQPRLYLADLVRKDAPETPIKWSSMDEPAAVDGQSKDSDGSG